MSAHYFLKSETFQSCNTVSRTAAFDTELPGTAPRVTQMDHNRAASRATPPGCLPSRAAAVRLPFLGGEGTTPLTAWRHSLPEFRS